MSRGRPVGVSDVYPRWRPSGEAQTASVLLKALFRIADRRKLSRYEIANGMDRTVTTISYWRHGGRTPSVLDVEEFASFLGIDLFKLLGGHDGLP